MLIAVSSLFFIADLIIKRLAAVYLASFASVKLLGFLHLSYVKNYGAAFGIFPNQRVILVLIGALICCLIVYLYSKTPKKDMISRFSYAAILGGSLSNLYDRITLGYVIDYLDFRFFPVFNLSDIAINLGIFLIIYRIVRGQK